MMNVGAPRSFGSGLPSVRTSISGFAVGTGAGAGLGAGVGAGEGVGAGDGTGVGSAGFSIGGGFAGGGAGGSAARAGRAAAATRSMAAARRIRKRQPRSAFASRPGSFSMLGATCMPRKRGPISWVIVLSTNHAGFG